MTEVVFDGFAFRGASECAVRALLQRKKDASPVELRLFQVIDSETVAPSLATILFC